MTFRSSLSVCLAFPALVGCAADSQPNVATSEDDLRVCAVSSTLTGVDVSKYQGNVDFDRVRNSGRAFAFTRVSDGLSSTDPKFAANYAAIKAAGLVRGTYQFFRSNRDPIAQADKLLAAINAAGGLSGNDLPPVLDLETFDGMSTASVAARAKQWLNRVEQATGRKPILYSSAAMSNVTVKLPGYVLWVANYGASCPSIPSGYKQWVFWQYSQSASVPGVPTKVDANYFQGTRAQLADLTMSGSGLPPRSIALTPDTSEAFEAVVEPGAIEGLPGLLEVPEGEGFMGASAGDL